MTTLCAQYSLELKFLDHTDGTSIDHDKIVKILELLINDAIETFNDVEGVEGGVTLGTVIYEADYEDVPE
jgi:hypothetical protein